MAKKEIPVKKKETPVSNEDPKLHFISDLFGKIYRDGARAVYAELHTGAGRANFFADTILAGIIFLVVITESTIEPIARWIYAAICPEALQYIEETSVMPQLVILFAMIMLCLMFMNHVETKWEERNK